MKKSEKEKQYIKTDYALGLVNKAWIDASAIFLHNPYPESMHEMRPQELMDWVHDYRRDLNADPASTWVMINKVAKEMLSYYKVGRMDK